MPFRRGEVVAYPNLVQRGRGPVARLVISADAIAGNFEALDRPLRVAHDL